MDWEISVPFGYFLEKIEFLVAILPKKLPEDYVKTILKVKLHGIAGVEVNCKKDVTFNQLTQSLIEKYGYNHGMKAKPKKKISKS